MKRKMMLINPHNPGRCGEESITVIVQMPLNLAYIAALTPGDWEFDVIDENIDLAMNNNGEITFAPVDLVCITAVTYQSPRAYKIATACRKRGMPVIMGGIHTSVMTEEAVNYADAVFVGGALMNNFFKEAGVDIGKSVYEKKNFSDSSRNFTTLGYGYFP